LAEVDDAIGLQTVHQPEDPVDSAVEWTVENVVDDLFGEGEQRVVQRERFEIVEIDVHPQKLIVARVIKASAQCRIEKRDHLYPEDRLARSGRGISDIPNECLKALRRFWTPDTRMG